MNAVNAVNTNDVIQIYVAVRESDIVQVEEFSDLFDPQHNVSEDAPLTYKEPERENLCQAWQKIRGDHGEPYAKSAAAVRNQSDAASVNKHWAATQHAEGMEFSELQEGLCVRSHGTVIL